MANRAWIGDIRHGCLINRSGMKDNPSMTPTHPWMVCARLVLFNVTFVNAFAKDEKIKLTNPHIYMYILRALFQNKISPLFTKM